MSNSYKKIFFGSFWGIFSTVFSAFIKIFTVPLLIGYYGKADFGLIALAFSLNAYLRLTEMGMNTGSIRYFSQWLAKNENEKIIGLSQSSMIFYGSLGIVNGIIVFLLGIHSDYIFQLNEQQYEVFNWICLILATSAFFNWISFVFVQLLTANEDFSWLKKTEIIRSILNLASVGVAIYFNYSLTLYFLLFIITNLSIIPLNLLRLRDLKLPILTLLRPKWNHEIFKQVLNYSLTIFAISLFQFTANYLRPILLGIFDTNGIDSVADFRILQSVTQLIIAVGGIFIGVLLPISSKKYSTGDISKNQIFIFDGTRYITVLLTYIVSLIVLNSAELLTIYVGTAYSELAVWLQIWSLTILIYLHNSPIASLVLASGKTKMLVFSSAIGTIVSILFIIFTVDSLKVGAAVLGFLIYIVVQMSFYYGYYNSKVFQINSMNLLYKSFIKPAVILLMPVILIEFICRELLYDATALESIISKTLLYHIIFLPLLLLFVVKIDEIKILIGKIRK